jgi:2,3,4,5-tetrahydropyridine-2-carboxylate N-succinyltransferase
VSSTTELEAALEHFAALETIAKDDAPAALGAFERLKAGLNAGTMRAAERQDDGTWRVNTWVKAGVLLGFRIGAVVPAARGAPFPFYDKDTWPLKKFSLADRVRIVPGGTSIRDGAYLAPGTVILPPSYVNAAAYVDEGTMVDSHVLIGSCAQIGKRVHLSAGVQIGGVLEPVGAVPVIIEDDVLVGGNSGIYEGTIVRERAVLAPGTILSGGTVVFDLVRETSYRREGDRPLEIPAGAVVVPGTRPVTSEAGRKAGVSLYAPVVVKYRDDRTDAAVRLEEWLR